MKEYIQYQKYFISLQIKIYKRIVQNRLYRLFNCKSSRQGYELI